MTTEQILLHTIERLIEETAEVRSGLAVARQRADTLAAQNSDLVERLHDADRDRCAVRLELERVRARLAIADGAPRRFMVLFKPSLLNEPGTANKIPMIKELRAALSIGLKAAHDAVNGEAHNFTIAMSAAKEINDRVKATGYEIALAGDAS